MRRVDHTSNRQVDQWIFRFEVDQWIFDLKCGLWNLGSTRYPNTPSQVQKRVEPRFRDLFLMKSTQKKVRVQG